MEFDDFLSDAQDAFLAGRLGLARAAYQRLLTAFALDEEVGTFSGPEPAPDMVNTDVSEAQARYLRAIYETTPANERAAVLAEAWFDLPAWNIEVSLAAVRETRRQDLPDLEQFLPAWIRELHSLGSAGPQVLKLLTEATELFSGLDGLGDLARQGGQDQANHYLQWVQALRRAARHTDAANAAREALAVLDAGGSAKALIAEELAELSHGDANQVLLARRSAWRASPSHDRLLALHWAATHTSDATGVMAAELAALESSANLDQLVGGLRASLMILAGRVDDVMEMLHEPTDYKHRPDRDVLVPYLLASGCTGPQHAEWRSTRLTGYLTSVDVVTQHGWWAGFGLAALGHPSDEEPTLSELFVQQIRAQADDEAVLTKRLDAALAEIEQQADTIVSNKARRQYASAAQLLTCCAEALILANRADDGIALIRRWRTRYSRHSAFQRELNAAVGQTALLTAAQIGTEA